MPIIRPFLPLSVFMTFFLGGPGSCRMHISSWGLMTLAPYSARRLFALPCSNLTAMHAARRTSSTMQAVSTDRVSAAQCFCSVASPVIDPAQSGRQIHAALCDIAYSLKRRGAGKTRRDRTDSRSVRQREAGRSFLRRRFGRRSQEATGLPSQRPTNQSCDSRPSGPLGGRSECRPCRRSVHLFQQIPRASASTKDAKHFNRAFVIELQHKKLVPPPAL